MLVYKELSFKSFQFQRYSKGTVPTLFQNILHYVQCTYSIDQSSFDTHFETMPNQIEWGFEMSPISISSNPEIVDPFAQPSDKITEQDPLWC